jgi:hypothetical protein
MSQKVSEAPRGQSIDLLLNHRGPIASRGPTIGQRTRGWKKNNFLTNQRLVTIHDNIKI